MKNKRNLKSIVGTKGFTLIELLAVIVVLGIILAIAIPKITETIEKSKYGSFVSSVKTYLKAAREYETEIGIDGNTPARDITSLSMGNKEGWSGEWTVDATGGVTFDYIGNGEYYFYNVNSSNIDSNLNDTTKVIKNGNIVVFNTSTKNYNPGLEDDLFVVNNEGELTNYNGEPTLENPDGYNIIIPNNVKKIKSRVFLNKSINTLIIPSEVIVEDNSFIDSNIKTLIIHDDIRFGYEVFLNADIQNIIFSDDITHISEGLFNTLKNDSTTVITLPKNLTNIGSSSFGNLNLNSITLPEGLKEIGGSAFAGAHIDHINIPSTVTTIGSNAFLNITGDAIIKNETNSNFDWDSITGNIGGCTKTTGNSNTIFITGSCVCDFNTVTITN